MLDPETEYSFKKIDPRRLASSKENDLEGFFLVLAVIYNDLKGNLHLQKDFYDTHKKPAIGEMSAYLGEYSGMTTQFQKTLASLINETFAFLKEYETLFQQPKFKLLFSNLPKEAMQEWSEILQAAREQGGKDKSTLAHKLMLIRNHVGFHYYQSENVLKRAYVEYFTENKRPESEFACYSLGRNMEETRFFYADAAVQFYLMKTAASEKIPFDERVDIYNQLQKETFEVIGTVNTVFGNLLRQYIRTKNEERSK